MLLADAHGARRWPSEAKAGTRFARGVFFAGVAGFAALLALVVAPDPSAPSGGSGRHVPHFPIPGRGVGAGQERRSPPGVP